MREARLIVPINDNQGKSLDHVHAEIAECLVSEFGGLTEIEAKGMWFNDARLFAENVYFYDVAMEVSKENEKKLVDIAMLAKKLAGQDAIYLRHANGYVHIF